MNLRDWAANRFGAGGTTLTSKKALLATALSLRPFKFADPLAIGILATKARAGQITLEDHEGELSTFLSRIGFYEYARLPDPHQINRREINQTIEIRSVTDSDAVYDRLRRLLRGDRSLATIEKIVVELIANVEMHAGSEGIILGQVAKGKIRLAIVDSGMGIHRSLTANPAYGTLSEQEAIRRSLEKGVTSGSGRGFGLWSAYEVLKSNTGDLQLGSGRYQYSLNTDKTAAAPFWQGTYVELAYDLGRPVDYTEVTGLAASYRIIEDDDLPF